VVAIMVFMVGETTMVQRQQWRVVGSYDSGCGGGGSGRGNGSDGCAVAPELMAVMVVRCG